MLFMPFLAFAQTNLEGLVKGSDGLLLQGVQVEIQETYFKTYTNQDGAFMFGKLGAGSYQLNFSVEGYEPLHKTIQLDNKGQNVQVVLNKHSHLMEEITVSAIRANSNTPTTYSELNLKEIEQTNFGQDLPFLLNSTPSTVVTSDAGAGIGYTGIRIRGVDPTRTNVTINGIPIKPTQTQANPSKSQPNLSKPTKT